MKLRKSLIMIAAVALLLTFAVSGTVAWIATSTDPVKNVFTPGTVDTEIEEPGWDGTTKSVVQIKNEGTVDVYVRVAIVGNWVKIDKEGQKQIVAPWTGSFDVGSGWIKGTTDGYYYYNSILKAGQTTTDLLGSDITASKNADGSYLEITVIHQSIQAEGMDATGAVDAFSKAAASN